MEYFNLGELAVDTAVAVLPAFLLGGELGYLNTIAVTEGTYSLVHKRLQSKSGGRDEYHTRNIRRAGFVAGAATLLNLINPENPGGPITPDQVHDMAITASHYAAPLLVPYALGNLWSLASSVPKLFRSTNIGKETFSPDDPE